jgi:hypothetical protein
MTETGVIMRHSIRLITVLMIMMGFAGPSWSQSPPPDFCETNDGFEQWDFWVGEWNVYSNDEARTLQGTNSITKHFRGCLIKEDWVGAAGGGGFSVNYFNPVRDEWRQVWVSNGYSIDYTGGLNDDGAMVLEGKIYNYATDSAQRFRGIWTPEDNGDVIQHFDVHNAESDEWTTWFEGRYVRKQDEPAGAE